MTTQTSLFVPEVARIEGPGGLREAFGGTSRVQSRRGDPRWDAGVLAAQQLVQQIREGARPLYHFSEAMSTSDFPAMFADSLDRQLYGAYQATIPTWQNYARAATVNDFRKVKRFATTGIRGPLSRVKELAEHERRTQEETPYEYAVDKYEAGFAVSWETMVNDDLNAFLRLPQDLAASVRDSEEKFVTELFCGANGPLTSVYNTPAATLVPGNPPLSRDSLQAALTMLLKRQDERGNPIVVTAIELVYGPGLALQAQQILETREYRAVDSAGNVQIITGNGVAANLRPNLNYWIPAVASEANSDTSWWLFANPNGPRPALEFGRLRGFEAPALYEKVPDMRRIGGGLEEFSFDTEAQEKKVKHVYGGAFVDQRMTVASNGTGQES